MNKRQAHHLLVPPILAVLLGLGVFAGVCADASAVDWNDECRELLDRPTSLPFRASSLRDGSVRTRIETLAREIRELESRWTIDESAAEPETLARSNYHQAISLLVHRVVLIFGATVDRSDPNSVRARESVERWFKALHELSLVVDADHRTYRDAATGRLLIKRNNYDRPRSSNFRVDREGKVFDLHIAGGLLHTSEGPLHGDGFMFVWSRDDRLRVARSTSGLYHDDLFPDEDVAMAGELSAHQGRPTLVTDQSGHFCPNRILMTQFREWLADRGVATPRFRCLAPE